MNSNPDDVEARLRRSLPAATAPELSSEIVTSAATRTAPRLGNPARRLQLAGGLTVAVAAVAVGALVVGPTFQQREPLFTAGGSSSGASSLSAEDSATSDSRLANWVNYEYVAGSGLSTSGGNGSVYQLKRTGDPKDRAAQLAGVFDVDGDAVKSQYFDPAYPSYVVGSEDGTAPSLTVTWSGTGNWWFNNPAANPPFECAGSDAGEPVDCVIVEPQLADSLAPSESEARSLAHDLFAKTGLDVAEKDIDVTVDAWQTMATANLVVNGTKTAIDFGINWSASTGELAWAYGHSIDVVDRGSYGTVSATDAVGRLADWRWFGSAGPDYSGGMNIMAMDTARSSLGADTPVSSEPSVGAPAETPAEEPTAAPTEPVDPSVDPTAPTEEPSEVPTEEPSVEPVPEPAPTPETVVVTVDTVEATLLLMWDSEGNAWLVPGFATKNPEGWWNTVVSLEEGIIELPAPVEIEPYLLETN